MKILGCKIFLKIHRYSHSIMQFWGCIKIENKIGKGPCIYISVSARTVVLNFNINMKVSVSVLFPISH